MNKQELDKQVLEYTKDAIRNTGFTCCNCKYSKVFDLNDDEDAYQCSRDDWGGEVCLKHSLAYCSAFEFKEEVFDKLTEEQKLDWMYKISIEANELAKVFDEACNKLALADKLESERYGGSYMKKEEIAKLICKECGVEVE